MSGIWKRKKRSDIQTPTNRKGRKHLRLNLTRPTRTIRTKSSRIIVLRLCQRQLVATTHLVQQRLAQPQFSRAGPDRHHYDPDRRTAHGLGDGAGMGARHDGGVAGDAGDDGRGVARQSAALLCAGHGWNGVVGGDGRLAVRRAAARVARAAFEDFSRLRAFVCIAAHQLLRSRTQSSLS
jgi:hypothetical protein